LTELAIDWETDTVGNFADKMRVSLLADVMSLQIVDIVDEKEL
jgi:hypothetical protein